MKLAYEAFGSWLNCVYDILSLPVYFVAQKPWETWRRRGAVKVESLNKGDPSGPYVRTDRGLEEKFMQKGSIDEVFRSAVAEFQDKPCFGHREVLGEEEELQPNGKKFKKLILGDYKWISFREAERKVNNVAKGFVSLGIKPKFPVVIFAETKMEWMISAQALFRIGAPMATLYATLGEEAIIHGVNETEVSCLITSQELLPKLKNIMDKIPNVKNIVYFESHNKANLEGFPESVRLIPFSELERIGATCNEELKTEPLKPSDVAIIMYTSGSTGVPKGVMISNRNIVVTIAAFAASLDSFQFMEDGTYLGYLPLAHMLEFAAETLVISNGFPVGYSTPQTMTDKSTAVKRGCKGDAAMLRPSFVAGVPLVLDRIRKSIEEAVKAQGPFSQGLFNFAMRYKRFWDQKGFGTPLLDRLVFGKIRQLLGGNVRLMFCGGAPLSPDTHEFIRTCLGCDLLQGYALTETSACATVMDVTDKSVGRVGIPLPGAYIKLRDWEEGGYRASDKPHPRGEIIIGGEGITLGYFKNDDLTKEVYREENGVRWFDSGDIGEVFPDGSVKIIDRKKDLVKLQFGEYISLGKVESELKTCPLVDNICVYGSSFHTTLVAIVVPNRKQLEAIANQAGKSGSISVLVEDPRVVAAFKDALVQYATKSGSLQKVEIPASVKLCKEEWTPDNGMVTAALKIRRHMIYEYYKQDINKMYGMTGEANGRAK